MRNLNVLGCEGRCIALFPDRFASYRLTIFKKLSDRSQSNYTIDIYADSDEDIKGLKLADLKYYNKGYAECGLVWRKVKNFTIGKVCFWQSGVIRQACSSKYNTFIYWGEANRLSTWIAAIINKLRGGKVVFWTHGIYGNEAFLKLKFRVLFYKLADAYLLYGDYSKQMMLKLGFESDKMFVINNSLDLSRQQDIYHRLLPSLNEFRAQYKGDSAYLLTFLGRLEPQKKLDQALRALKLLNENDPGKYKLMFVGDGTDRDRLQKLARDLKITEMVDFFGSCYHEETIAKVMMSSDICIAPGEVGLTAIHSLAYGTPVITHDDFRYQMPECESIRVGKSGAFFKRDDILNMAEVIQEVIAQVTNKVITSFTCQQVIKQYYSVDFQSGVFNQLISYLDNDEN